MYKFLNFDCGFWLCLGRENQRTGHDKCRADILLCDLAVIIDFISLKNDLQIAESAAVVQFYKAKCIACADRARPAAYGDLFVSKVACRRINAFNRYSLHNNLSFTI